MVPKVLRELYSGVGPDKGVIEKLPVMPKGAMLAM